eukprot:NODE_419_length_1722_cov_35.150628_g304_i0.p1 GENE.NODE_419_length_1722_cov_35.150628_g304_i0~~NODE_419_length_1722_cov_35.150628_g304_i0.p1  ORF type:complete len:471 (+),score=87.64 NODE_419_length_1722_cov_35.150628_g304_i0:75-1487(+)
MLNKRDFFVDDVGLTSLSYVPRIPAAVRAPKVRPPPPGTPPPQCCTGRSKLVCRMMGITRNTFNDTAQELHQIPATARPYQCQPQPTADDCMKLLPDPLLLLVCAFAANPLAQCVNHQWNAIMHLRHVTRTTMPTQTEVELLWGACSYTVKLNLPHLNLHAEAAHGLQLLANVHSLHQVSLHLHHCKLTDHGARAIAALWRLPALTMLEIDLSHSNLDSQAVHDIIPVDCSGPTTLVIKLTDCTGTGTFPALPPFSCLRHLTLDLGWSQPGKRIWPVWSLWQRTPPLVRLTLNLSGCGLGDAKNWDLVGLLSSPSLAHLNLNLAHNSMGHAGMKELMHCITQLQHVRLVSLTLNLANCGLCSDTVDLIGSLFGPRLAHLNLNLAENNVGSATLESLMNALVAAPMLETLSLNLEGNHIWDEDLLYCRDLVKVPKLKKVGLALKNNLVGVVGVGHLIKLRCAARFSLTFTS